MKKTAVFVFAILSAVLMTASCDHAPLSIRFPTTATSTGTATETDTSAKCLVVNTAPMSAGDAEQTVALTAAAGEKGFALAFYEAISRTVRVNMYDVRGELLTTMSSAAMASQPTTVKMVGDGDEYVLAIEDQPASKNNGWLADYSIYRVRVGMSFDLIAQPKNVRGLSLAFDGREFYSVEVTVNGLQPSSCGEPVEILCLEVHPLLSGLKPGTFQLVSHGMNLADASIVDDKLAVLMTGGGFDCEKRQSWAWISIQEIQNNGDYVFGGRILDNPMIGIGGTKPETYSGISLLYSPSRAGMFWEKTFADNANDPEFHISMWENKDYDTPTVVGGQKQYGDRPAVLGWDDNIIQVVEEGSQVSIFVVGDSDAAGESRALYQHTTEQHVRSFAGKDGRFVILDDNPAAAVFVACEK